MKDETTSEPVQALRRFNCLRHQAIIEVFSSLPLQDPAHYKLLIGIDHLSRGTGLPNQRDLAGEIQRAPATVTASLKVLERQGLIRRTQDSEDQRVNRVELTEEGSFIANRCRDRMEALERQVIQGFSPEEIDSLIHLLNKMSDNLSEVLSIKKEANPID